MTSCRNRSRSPSSPSTRPVIPSASTPNSSTTGRSIVTDRSVTVKLDPRIEANRSACSVSSDRKLRRRRMVSRNVGGSTVCATSARLPAVSSIPSCASAPSISVTNSGLPAAPASPASSPRPGAAPIASAARSATACAPRPPRLRHRPGGPSSAAASRSSSGERGEGRKHAMRPTGRYSARRPSAASVSRLDESAHCRSSTPITSGPASASSSTRSASASTRTLTAQEIAARGALADRADHIRGDGRGRQPQAHLGGAEARIAGGDRDIAGGDQPHAAAERRTVHPGDRRLGRLRQRAQHPRQAPRVLEIGVIAGGRLLLHPRQIGAGTEVAPAAGQYDGAHARLLRQLRKAARQLAHQSLVKRVVAFGPVEPDDGAAGAILELQELVARHARYILKTPKRVAPIGALSAAAQTQAQHAGASAPGR